MHNETGQVISARVRHGLWRFIGLLLAALIPLSLTSCREDGDEGDRWRGPVTSRTGLPEGGSDPYTDDNDDYTDAGWDDDSDGSGNPDVSDEQDAGVPDEGYGDVGTNHCAFPGDTLCPDTPIKVPPPNLHRW
jgi:hypothetical protein